MPKPNPGQILTLPILIVFCTMFSLQSAFSGTDDRMVRVYAEISHLRPTDSVEFQFWDHIIKENARIPSPHSPKPVPEPGNIFDGSMGHAKYIASHLPTGDFVRFSILINGHPILHNYLLEAGSGLRVRIGNHDLSLAFGGSAAPMAETQHRLATHFRGRTFNRPPLMVTGNPDRFRTGPTFGEPYAKAKADSSDLRLLMRFLDSGESNRQYLDFLLTENPLEDEAFRILDHAKRLIGEDAATILRADVYATLLDPIFDQFGRTFGNLSDTPDPYIQTVLPLIHIPLDDLYAQSPAFLETASKMAQLATTLYGTGYFDYIDGLPGRLRDMVYARFLFDNSSIMEDPAPYFRRALSGMETPWLRSLLEEKIGPRMPGRPLPDAALLDTGLRTVHLSSFAGKKVFLTFWITGCKFCLQFRSQVLDRLMAETEGREDILLIAVNADRDPSAWQRDPNPERYVPDGMLSLWGGQEGGGLADQLSITAFPSKVFIDENGSILLSAIQTADPDYILGRISAFLNDPNHQPKPH